jgi:hypothetical protein
LDEILGSDTMHCMTEPAGISCSAPAVIETGSANSNVARMRFMEPPQDPLTGTYLAACRIEMIQTWQDIEPVVPQILA